MDDVEYVDFKKWVNVNLAPYDQMIYDVYEIDSTPLESNYYHVQQTTTSRTNPCHGMSDKYSHGSKPLNLYNTKQNIKVIGQAEYYFDNGYNIRIVR